MKILKWIQDTFDYLWNGVARLFGPSEDNYPKTGVQPFEGEPYDDTKEEYY